MEETNHDVKIREALNAVAQYLSDTIPPVHAVDPVMLLLKGPAKLMASAIINWIPSQFHRNSRNASPADCLFYAISKLHYLGHLQLISEQDLVPYLDSIKRLLLDYCPPKDRLRLQDSFGHIGMSEDMMTAPISFIRRPVKPNGSKAGSSDGHKSGRPEDRRRSILNDRLKSAMRQPLLPAENEQRQDPVPQLIAMAAADARSDKEFRRLQEDLKALGIESRMDQIYRMLSRSLPGWMISSTGTDPVKSHNPAIVAMGQIIRLAEDRWESSRRFQNMIQAAIEHFNTGSLARAATMLDLALGICTDDKLDPAAVTRVRKTAHESLDLNRLRSVAKQSDKRHLLRTVLNFFDAFSVENLLDSLQKEGRRDRRILFLDLLETYGDSAHTGAFENLKELLAGTNVATDWYFARNLICILNRTPSTGDVPPQKEIELIAPLFRLSLSAPLVKEAIKFAGRTRCVESEELLISAADKLEKVVLEHAASGRDSAQKLSLLDRAIYALAHYGTPKGYGRAVKHGLSRRKELGDTAARLNYLSGQDLSEDKESLALLIKFLKSKTPRKLLGVTIHRHENDQLLIHAIRALSSTPAPVVRKTFEEIAAQFPGTKFGETAARALKEFEELDKSGTPAGRLLAGDLELFGLADLLRQLNLLQVTGTLTLKDAKAIITGTFSLIAGRLQDCRAGALGGKEAAYQLLEVPMAGTFVFQGQRNSGTSEQPDVQSIPDLSAVVSEGMRRYDEMQRARAIVPDFALLRRRGCQPVMHGGEEDAGLFDRVWQNTPDGASPEECEAACRVDSYRVRTLLARWVEEGILTVE